MKTLEYYLSTLDKSAQSEYIDIEELGRKVGVSYWGYLSNDECPELKCYFLYSWTCTDTRVGLRAYYLNDVLIAASFQPARKSDEDFYWESDKAINALRDYIWEKGKKAHGDMNFNYIDWKEDLSGMETEKGKLGGY